MTALKSITARLAAGPRVILVVAVIAAAASLMPAVAKADYYPGLYAPGLMVCQYGKVYTTSPVMISQAPNQWMTFIDDLYHWDGRNWVYLRSSQQMFHRGSADIFDEATRSDTHDWQLSNGTFVDGSWTFAAFTGNYYKVRQRLYWYATPESNAISITTWSTIDGLTNIPLCQVNP